MENLEKKTDILKSENSVLVKTNKGLKELYAVKAPELDRQIAELKERNANLQRETEAFKANTQKEIQDLQDRGVDKMKVFHENAETRVKSLWNRAQYDYGHLNKRLTDHLRNYLDNVNELLSEFNNKAVDDDLGEGEREVPNKAGGVAVAVGNGNSAQKETVAKNTQGSGSKTNGNSKTPVAMRK